MFWSRNTRTDASSAGIAESQIRLAGASMKDTNQGRPFEVWNVDGAGRGSSGIVSRVKCAIRLIARIAIVGPKSARNSRATGTRRWLLRKRLRNDAT